MNYKELFEKAKNRELNGEQVLESLVENGICPNLLFDDNGHWAISLDGFQNVASGEDTSDVGIVSFVEAADWKNSIYEAVVHTLERLISETE